MLLVLSTGIVLDLTKSLHNQGIMEQEHIQLAQDPGTTDTDEVVLQLSENARTEGAITRSESVGSEVGVSLTTVLSNFFNRKICLNGSKVS